MVLYFMGFLCWAMRVSGRFANRPYFNLNSANTMSTPME